MPAKKVIITAVVTLVGVGGIITGALLLKERQDLRSRAAVPGGRAEMRIEPSSGRYEVGDTIPVSLFLNTDGVAISGFQARLQYSFSGASPEVTTTDVTVSSDLQAIGNWSCPTKEVTEEFGKVNIDVSCATVSASGYSTSSDVLIASMNLNITRTPAASPFLLEFDTGISSVIQKSNGEDILNDGVNSGVFTIRGVPVATATTAPVVTTTVIPTVTTAVLTSTPTPTTFVISTVTPTSAATSGGTLPDAGVSMPTLMALGAGLLLVFGALALAL